MKDALSHTISAAEIRRDHQNFLISGNLVFETVVALRQEGDAIIYSEAVPCFDFREVTRSDSSAIALLLAWVQKAKTLNKSIRFINLPQSMLDMAQAFDVKSFFSLNPE